MVHASAALPAGVEAHHGEVDALGRGGLVGEVPAGADGPADEGVDALDGVGGADDGADLGVEGQDRHELRPCLLPQPDDRRIPVAPSFGELGEPGPGSRLGRRGVDGLESFGDGVPVLPASIPKRGPATAKLRPEPTSICSRVAEPVDGTWAWLRVRVP